MKTLTKFGGKDKLDNLLLKTIQKKSEKILTKYKEGPKEQALLNIKMLTNPQKSQKSFPTHKNQ